MNTSDETRGAAFARAYDHLVAYVEGMLPLLIASHGADAPTSLLRQVDGRMWEFLRTHPKWRTQAKAEAAPAAGEPGAGMREEGTGEG